MLSGNYNVRGGTNEINRIKIDTEIITRLIRNSRNKNNIDVKDNFFYACVDK
jgi:hypothetical protein